MVDNGYEIQVGDKIKVTNRGFKSSIYTVHRVTKKFAFVFVNEKAVVKFPRVYDYRFQTLPRNLWDTNDYEVMT